MRVVPEIHFVEAVRDATAGDNPEARGQLFTMLYDELRRMAHRELRRGAAITLSPTTLLHETYLNISQRQSLAFSDSGQFMSYAARAMRGLIVDHLRNRHAQKRGAGFEITSLPTEVPAVSQERAGESIQVDKLNDALESLASIDARLAECVDLKFFCGFSFTEIAQLRKVSERTVQRDWDKARVLLSRIMNDPEYDLDDTSQPAS
jgi:RNA polymerase sigma factor (TIGR02999 family)